MIARLGGDALKRPRWARYLRQARTSLDLTQAQLAEMLNVSQSTVTDWETGKTKPRPHLWLQLEAKLGLELVAELVKDTNLAKGTTVARKVALRTLLPLHLYTKENFESGVNEGVMSVPFIELTPSQQFEVFYERLLEAAQQVGVDARPAGIAGIAYERWEAQRSRSSSTMFESNLEMEVARFREQLEEKRTTDDDR